MLQVLKIVFIRFRLLVIHKQFYNIKTKLYHYKTIAYKSIKKQNIYTITKQTPETFTIQFIQQQNNI